MWGLPHISSIQVSNSQKKVALALGLIAAPVLQLWLCLALGSAGDALEEVRSRHKQFLWEPHDDGKADGWWPYQGTQPC